MTDPNKTHITAILDRSGSMRPLAVETIGGFNRFLADQKAAPGTGTLTMVLFDDKYETPHKDVNLQSVPDLTDKVYYARGMTALYDAIGKAVIETGATLAAMSEDQRPGSVIVLIITDGQENASHDFANEEGRLKVQEMDKHQTDVYGWNFIFMGANIDAKAVGGSLGVDTSRSFNYTPDSVGTQAVYNVASSGTKGLRHRASVGESMKSFGLVDDPNAVLGGPVLHSTAVQGTPDPVTPRGRKTGTASTPK